MPELGEVKKARELGCKGTNNYIWHACEKCGKERWVQSRKGQPARLRCVLCSKAGEKSPSWKGGRVKHDKGYMQIKLQPDSFFYPMTNHQGYILEHRLVYAQHLGRCLQSWEIVNHRNGKLNEKGEKDNSFSNLQLTTRGQHEAITQMENKIDRQTTLIDDLRKEIRLLRWQLSELIGEHRLLK